MKKNSSVRFNFDFINKTIYGTKADFDKAGKGFGPAYDELVEKMTQQPNFSCVIVEPDKPVKVKQTYKGMTVKFMLDYANAVGENAFSNEMKEIQELHKKNKEKNEEDKGIDFSVYPTIKRMFLEHYAPNEDERFAYGKAKKIVSAYRHNNIIAKVAKHTEPAKDEAAEDIDLSEAVGF